MSDLRSVLAALVAEFTAERARAALVGGLAVSVRTEPRFTRDIDLAVAVADDMEAERLVAGLAQGGYRPVAAVEHEAAGRLATVRLLPPDALSGGVLVDLLFASSGIEPEVVAHAETLEVIPGVVVPVATIGHLLALKLLSVDERRTLDRADLDALAQVASEPDFRVARAAVELITERGFHRERDLVKALAELMANH